MQDRGKERKPTKEEAPRKHDVSFRIYDLLTGDEDARLCRDIPDDQCREQPKNFLCQVLAQALSKTGDALADTKVVLPWLLGAVGAPGFMVGLLVPIRESLALLPQMLIGGVIRRFPVRKGFWSLSSLVEGLCILAMGLAAAAGLSGVAAGWLILGLLVIFSLARGVASIAAKDTLGKTVSKGRRGRVSGYAASLSGIAAAAVGIYLAVSPEEARPDWLLTGIVMAAGLAWIAAAAVFYRIDEYPGAIDGGRSLRDLLRDQIRLLLKDPELQKFLLARTLMISTALVGPAYVGLAQRDSGENLAGLGWLMIASGLAGSVSSAFWGKLADSSSRLTMALAALLAGLLGLVAVTGLVTVPDVGSSIVFYAAILFILGIAHAGVRIGRKTHVVDLAGGDRKAEYVALSNSIVGVMLLAIGALASALMGMSLEVAIVTLSLLSICGALAALAMTNAQS